MSIWDVQERNDWETVWVCKSSTRKQRLRLWRYHFTTVQDWGFEHVYVKVQVFESIHRFWFQSSWRRRECGETIWLGAINRKRTWTWDRIVGRVGEAGLLWFSFISCWVCSWIGLWCLLYLFYKLERVKKISKSWGGYYCQKFNQWGLEMLIFGRKIASSHY